MGIFCLYRLIKRCEVRYCKRIDDGVSNDEGCPEKWMEEGIFETDHETERKNIKNIEKISKFEVYKNAVD
jgi:hypothetical protein